MSVMQGGEDGVTVALKLRVRRKIEPRVHSAQALFTFAAHKAAFRQPYAGVSA